MKEYQKILKARYKNVDKQYMHLLEFMCKLPSEYEFEDEILSWLRANPNADLQEVAAYEGSFVPPLEIVDDDELDEDERNELVYQD